MSLDDDEDDLMRAGEGDLQRGGRVRQRCRHRHFSLEDYQGHESEDSNLSSLSMGLNCDNSGTAATEVEEDANHSVLMSFRKNGELLVASGVGFMVVVDFTNLILRHVQTSKTCCRLVLIYNRIVDLQQNPRFTTTMNPAP